MRSVLPERLAGEVLEVSQTFPEVRLVEVDGLAGVYFATYPVPAGFSHRETRLLLKFPIAYPNGQPDMFWTAEELRLADGRTPRSADQVETALSMQWRRFSWHPQGWNPATCNLRTFLAFVDSRLARPE